MVPTIEEVGYRSFEELSDDPFQTILIRDRSQLQLDALRAAARLQKTIEEAQLSPLGLYRMCFSANDGGPLFIKWFHEEWNTIFMTERNFLIEGARGLTKTTFVTACVLWMIGRNPNVRITWLSSNDKQASKRLRATRRHIEENKLYQACFPQICISKAKEDSNTTDTLTVERDAVLVDPTIEAKGVLSSGVGSRIDVLILDDIVDQRNALLYPNMRPMVLNKLQSDWMQTVDQRYGRIIAIFNTWHREDAHEWLKANTGWKHKKYCHGKPGDPYHSLFPELFPRDRLIALRRAEGPINYARGRLCRALTDETVAIMPSQFLAYNRRLLTKQVLETASAVVVIDPASGKLLDKGKLDYSGVCVLLYSPVEEVLANGTRHVKGYHIFVPECYQVNLRRRQLIVLVKQLIRQWRPERVLIEAEGLADFHTPLLEDQSVDPEIILPVTSRSRSKGQRLLGVSSLFYPPEGHAPIIYFHPKVIEDPPSKDKVVLLDGTVAVIERTAKMQIVNFPTDHDDAMDTLVYGLDFIRSHMAPDGIDFLPQVSLEPVTISRASAERKAAARAEADSKVQLPPNPADWPFMPAMDELLKRFAS